MMPKAKFSLHLTYRIGFADNRSARVNSDLSKHTLFLSPEFLAHCRAERFARPIHGVANL